MNLKLYKNKILNNIEKFSVNAYLVGDVNNKFTSSITGLSNVYYIKLNRIFGRFSGSINNNRSADLGSLPCASTNSSTSQPARNSTLISFWAYVAHRNREIQEVGNYNSCNLNKAAFRGASKYLVSGQTKIGNPLKELQLSPWPLLLSIFLCNAALVTIGLLNGVIYNGLFLFLSTVLVIGSIITWLLDVSREGSFIGNHISIVRSSLYQGVGLFIVSEIMFFFSLFWTFFNAILSGSVWVGCSWPPVGLDTYLSSTGLELAVVNTCILLFSGYTLTLAHEFYIRKNKFLSLYFLAFTIGLGIFFMFIQVIEFQNALFGFNDAIYSSIFFFLTGFHGFHVVLGIKALLFSYYRSALDYTRSDQHLGFEAAIWYWHFVDVVWLFVFSLIYVWGNASTVNSSASRDIVYYSVSNRIIPVTAFLFIFLFLFIYPNNYFKNFIYFYKINMYKIMTGLYFFIKTLTVSNLLSSKKFTSVSNNAAVLPKKVLSENSAVCYIVALMSSISVTADLPAVHPYSQTKLQDSATLVAFASKHFFLSMYILTLFIVSFVLFITLVFVYSHEEDASKKKFVEAPQKTHNTFLETIWTTLPSGTISTLAASSFILLFISDVGNSFRFYGDIISNKFPATLRTRVTGSQWFWTYNYDLPKFTELSDAKSKVAHTLEQVMRAVDNMLPGEHRLLSTGDNLVLPTFTLLRFYITSTDVIHSFALPSMYIKLDACPGRLNLLSTVVTRIGAFYGQCSEICGINHSFMPISTEVVDSKSFWSGVTNFIKEQYSFLAGAVYNDIKDDQEIGEDIKTLTFIDEVNETFYAVTSSLGAADSVQAQEEGYVAGAFPTEYSTSDIILFSREVQTLIIDKGSGEDSNTGYEIVSRDKSTGEPLYSFEHSNSLYFNKLKWIDRPAVNNNPFGIIAPESKSLIDIVSGLYFSKNSDVSSVIDRLETKAYMSKYGPGVMDNKNLTAEQRNEVSWSAHQAFSLNAFYKLLGISSYVAPSVDLTDTLAVRTEDTRHFNISDSGILATVGRFLGITHRNLTSYQGISIKFSVKPTNENFFVLTGYSAKYAISSFDLSLKIDFRRKSLYEFFTNRRWNVSSGEEIELNSFHDVLYKSHKVARFQSVESFFKLTRNDIFILAHEFSMVTEYYRAYMFYLKHRNLKGNFTFSLDPNTLIEPMLVDFLGKRQLYDPFNFYTPMPADFLNSENAWVLPVSTRQVVHKMLFLRHDPVLTCTQIYIRDFILKIFNSIKDFQGDSDLNYPPLPTFEPVPLTKSENIMNWFFSILNIELSPIYRDRTASLEESWSDLIVYRPLLDQNLDLMAVSPRVFSYYLSGSFVDDFLFTPVFTISDADKYSIKFNIDFYSAFTDFVLQLYKLLYIAYININSIESYSSNSWNTLSLNSVDNTEQPLVFNYFVGADFANYDEDFNSTLGFTCYLPVDGLLSFFTFSSLFTELLNSYRGFVNYAINPFFIFYKKHLSWLFISPSDNDDTVSAVQSTSIAAKVIKKLLFFDYFSDYYNYCLDYIDNYLYLDFYDSSFDDAYFWRTANLEDSSGFATPSELLLTHYERELMYIQQKPAVVFFFRTARSELFTLFNTYVNNGKDQNFTQRFLNFYFGSRFPDHLLFKNRDGSHKVFLLDLFKSDLEVFFELAGTKRALGYEEPVQSFKSRRLEDRYVYKTSISTWRTSWQETKSTKIGAARVEFEYLFFFLVNELRYHLNKFLFKKLFSGWAFDYLIGSLGDWVWLNCKVGSIYPTLNSYYRAKGEVLWYIYTHFFPSFLQKQYLNKFLNARIFSEKESYPYISTKLYHEQKELSAKNKGSWNFGKTLIYQARYDKTYYFLDFLNYKNLKQILGVKLSVKLPAGVIKGKKAMMWVKDEKSNDLPYRRLFSLGSDKMVHRRLREPDPVYINLHCPTCDTYDSYFTVKENERYFSDCLPESLDTVGKRTWNEKITPHPGALLNITNITDLDSFIIDRIFHFECLNENCYNTIPVRASEISSSVQQGSINKNATWVWIASCIGHAIYEPIMRPDGTRLFFERSFGESHRKMKFGFSRTNRAWDEYGQRNKYLIGSHQLSAWLKGSEPILSKVTDMKRGYRMRPLQYSFMANKNITDLRLWSWPAFIDFFPPIEEYLHVSQVYSKTLPVHNTIKNIDRFIGNKESNFLLRQYGSGMYTTSNNIHSIEKTDTQAVSDPSVRKSSSNVVENLVGNANRYVAYDTIASFGLVSAMSPERSTYFSNASSSSAQTSNTLDLSSEDVDSLLLGAANRVYGADSSADITTPTKSNKYVTTKTHKVNINKPTYTVPTSNNILVYGSNFSKSEELSEGDTAQLNNFRTKMSRGCTDKVLSNEIYQDIVFNNAAYNKHFNKNVWKFLFSKSELMDRQSTSLLNYSAKSSEPLPRLTKTFNNSTVLSMLLTDKYYQYGLNVASAFKGSSINNVAAGFDNSIFYTGSFRNSIENKYSKQLLSLSLSLDDEKNWVPPYGIITGRDVLEFCDRIYHPAATFNDINDKFRTGFTGINNSWDKTRLSTTPEFLLETLPENYRYSNDYNSTYSKAFPGLFSNMDKMELQSIPSNTVLPCTHEVYNEYLSHNEKVLKGLSGLRELYVKKDKDYLINFKKLNNIYPVRDNNLLTDGRGYIYTGEAPFEKIYKTAISNESISDVIIPIFKLAGLVDSELNVNTDDGIDKLLRTNLIKKLPATPLTLGLTPQSVMRFGYNSYMYTALDTVVNEFNTRNKSLPINLIEDTFTNTFVQPAVYSKGVSQLLNNNVDASIPGINKGVWSDLVKYSEYNTTEGVQLGRLLGKDYFKALSNEFPALHLEGPTTAIIRTLSSEKSVFNLTAQAALFSSERYTDNVFRYPLGYNSIDSTKRAGLFGVSTYAPFTNAAEGSQAIRRSESFGDRMVVTRRLLSDKPFERYLLNSTNSGGSLDFYSNGMESLGYETAGNSVTNFSFYRGRVLWHDDYDFVWGDLGASKTLTEYVHDKELDNIYIKPLIVPIHGDSIHNAYAASAVMGYEPSTKKEWEHIKRFYEDYNDVAKKILKKSNSSFEDTLRMQELAGLNNSNDLMEWRNAVLSNNTQSLNAHNSLQNIYSSGLIRIPSVLDQTDGVSVSKSGTYPKYSAYAKNIESSGDADSLVPVWDIMGDKSKLTSYAGKAVVKGQVLSGDIFLDSCYSELITKPTTKVGAKYYINTNYNYRALRNLDLRGYIKNYNVVFPKGRFSSTDTSQAYTSLLSQRHKSQLAFVNSAVSNNLFYNGPYSASSVFNSMAGSSVSNFYLPEIFNNSVFTSCTRGNNMAKLAGDFGIISTSSLAGNYNCNNIFFEDTYISNKRYLEALTNRALTPKDIDGVLSKLFLDMSRSVFVDPFTHVRGVLQDNREGTSLTSWVNGRSKYPNDIFDDNNLRFFESSIGLFPPFKDRLLERQPPMYFGDNNVYDITGDLGTNSAIRQLSNNITFGGIDQLVYITKMYNASSKWSIIPFIKANLKLYDLKLENMTEFDTISRLNGFSDRVNKGYTLSSIDVPSTYKNNNSINNIVDCYNPNIELYDSIEVNGSDYSSGSAKSKCDNYTSNVLKPLLDTTLFNPEKAIAPFAPIFNKSLYKNCIPYLFYNYDSMVLEYEGRVKRANYMIFNNEQPVLNSNNKNQTFLLYDFINYSDTLSDYRELALSVAKPWLNALSLLDSLHRKFEVAYLERQGLIRAEKNEIVDKSNSIFVSTVDNTALDYQRACENSSRLVVQAFLSTLVFGHNDEESGLFIKNNLESWFCRSDSTLDSHLANIAIALNLKQVLSPETITYQDAAARDILAPSSLEATGSGRIYFLLIDWYLRSVNKQNSPLMFEEEDCDLLHWDGCLPPTTPKNVVSNAEDLLTLMVLDMKLDYETIRTNCLKAVANLAAFDHMLLTKDFVSVLSIVKCIMRLDRVTLLQYNYKNSDSGSNCVVSVRPNVSNIILRRSNGLKPLTLRANLPIIQQSSYDGSSSNSTQSVKLYFLDDKPNNYTRKDSWFNSIIKINMSQQDIANYVNYVKMCYSGDADKVPSSNVIRSVVGNSLIKGDEKAINFVKLLANNISNERNNTEHLMLLPFREEINKNFFSTENTHVLDKIDYVSEPVNYIRSLLVTMYLNNNKTFFTEAHSKYHHQLIANNPAFTLPEYVETCEDEFNSMFSLEQFIDFAGILCFGKDWAYKKWQSILLDGGVEDYFALDATADDVETEIANFCRDNDIDIEEEAPKYFISRDVIDSEAQEKISAGIKKEEELLDLIRCFAAEEDDEESIINNLQDEESLDRVYSIVNHIASENPQTFNFDYSSNLEYQPYNFDFSRVTEPRTFNFDFGSGDNKQESVEEDQQIAINSSQPGLGAEDIGLGLPQQANFSSVHSVLYNNSVIDDTVIFTDNTSIRLTDTPEAANLAKLAAEEALKLEFFKKLVRLYGMQYHWSGGVKRYVFRNAEDKDICDNLNEVAHFFSSDVEANTLYSQQSKNVVKNNNLLKIVIDNYLESDEASLSEEVIKENMLLALVSVFNRPNIVGAFVPFISSWNYMFITTLIEKYHLDTVDFNTQKNFVRMKHIVDCNYTKSRMEYNGFTLFPFANNGSTPYPRVSLLNSKISLSNSLTERDLTVTTGKRVVNWNNIFKNNNSYNVNKHCLKSKFLNTSTDRQLLGTKKITKKVLSSQPFDSASYEASKSFDPTTQSILEYYIYSVMYIKNDVSKPLEASVWRATAANAYWTGLIETGFRNLQSQYIELPNFFKFGMSTDMNSLEFKKRMSRISQSYFNTYLKRTTPHNEFLSNRTANFSLLYNIYKKQLNFSKSTGKLSQQRGNNEAQSSSISSLKQNNKLKDGSTQYVNSLELYRDMRSMVFNKSKIKRHANKLKYLSGCNKINASIKSTAGGGSAVGAGLYTSWLDAFAHNVVSTNYGQNTNASYSFGFTSNNDSMGSFTNVSTDSTLCNAAKWHPEAIKAEVDFVFYNKPETELNLIETIVLNTQKRDLLDVNNISKFYAPILLDSSTKYSGAANNIISQFFQSCLPDFVVGNYVTKPSGTSENTEFRQLKGLWYDLDATVNYIGNRDLGISYAKTCVKDPTLSADKWCPKVQVSENVYVVPRIVYAYRLQEVNKLAFSALNSLTKNNREYASGLSKYRGASFSDIIKFIKPGLSKAFDPEFLPTAFKFSKLGFKQTNASNGDSKYRSLLGDINALEHDNEAQKALFEMYGDYEVLGNRWKLEHRQRDYIKDPNVVLTSSSSGAASLENLLNDYINAEDDELEDLTGEETESLRKYIDIAKKKLEYNVSRIDDIGIYNGLCNNQGYLNVNDYSSLVSSKKDYVGKYVYVDKNFGFIKTVNEEGLTADLKNIKHDSPFYINSLTDARLYLPKTSKAGESPEEGCLSNNLLKPTVVLKENSELAWNRFSGIQSDSWDSTSACVSDIIKFSNFPSQNKETVSFFEPTVGVRDYENRSAWSDIRKFTTQTTIYRAVNHFYTHDYVYGTGLLAYLGISERVADTGFRDTWDGQCEQSFSDLDADTNWVNGQKIQYSFNYVPGSNPLLESFVPVFSSMSPSDAINGDNVYTVWSEGISSYLTTLSKGQNKSNSINSAHALDDRATATYDKIFNSSDNTSYSFEYIENRSKDKDKVKQDNLAKLFFDNVENSIDTITRNSYLRMNGYYQPDLKNDILRDDLDFDYTFSSVNSIMFKAHSKMQNEVFEAFNNIIDRVDTYKALQKELVLLTNPNINKSYADLHCLIFNQITLLVKDAYLLARTDDIDIKKLATRLFEEQTLPFSGEDINFRSLDYTRNPMDYGDMFWPSDKKFSSNFAPVYKGRFAVENKRAFSRS